MRRSAWLGPVVVAVAGFVVFGWPGAGAALAVWLFFPRFVERRQRRRTGEQLGRDLASVLELAARGVRTGEPPLVSLRQAADLTGGETGRVIDRILGDVGTEQSQQGTTPPTRSVGDPSTAVVVATLHLVQGREGGAARAFEAGAALLRERERRAGEAEAAAAQARASSRLLVGAPAVVSVGTLVTSPGLPIRLLSEPLALGCLGLGIGLEVAGNVWMRRMVAEITAIRS